MENSNKKAAIGDVTSAEAMKNIEEEEFIAYLEQHYPKCPKVYKKDKIGFTTAEIADSLGLMDRMIRRAYEAATSDNPSMTKVWHDAEVLAAERRRDLTPHNAD